MLPMSHIVGYSVLLISTLMHGATLHVVPKADPAALAKAIADEGITTLFGVPRHLSAPARIQGGAGARQACARQAADDVRGRRTARSRAEGTHRGRVRHSLLNNYGITECSPGLFRVREDELAGDDTVGRFSFLPGIEYRVVDPQGTRSSPARSANCMSAGST